MNKPADENGALQSFAGAHFPERRQFVKGMAALGAALAVPSISAEVVATRTQAVKPTLGSDPPVADAWGPFTPSSSAGRYLQVTYPASTAKGELQIAATYTLWLPDNVKTVRAE